MFYQIFHSTQVKRSRVVCNKHGIYMLPNHLPNDLRLRMLGSSEKLEKCENFLELKTSAQSSCQNENIFNTGRKLLKC